MKELDITIPKCDCVNIPFLYKENGKLAKLDEEHLIFFSVKKDLHDEEYVIQKTLNSGIIFVPEVNHYYIQFNLEDTNQLKMGTTFLYDLTIYYNGAEPNQEFFGKFKVGPKITLNEVVENE